jgi:hypothetical protein
VAHRKWLALFGLWALAGSLHGYQALAEWTDVSFGLGVALWSIAPYLATVALTMFTQRPLYGIVPTASAPALDVYTSIAVRLSHSSTAALTFLWVPFWNLVLVLPLSVGVLWPWSRRANRGEP